MIDLAQSKSVVIIHDPDQDAALDAEGRNASAHARINAELLHVLGSKEFQASERNRRFLEYIVSETLAGRADRIKAYNIATQVFGRDVNFDPQLDPVVRMEARRLRGSLEHFYLTEGKSSPVRITIPKGCYVPEFKLTHTAEPEIQLPGPLKASSDLSWGQGGIRVRVVPFDWEGDWPAPEHFHHGLAGEVIVAMSRFAEMSVYASTIEPWQGLAADSERVGNEPICDLVLTGGTASSNGMLSVRAMFLDSRSGRVVWGKTFERDLKGMNPLRLRDELASSIVRAFALPSGIIPGSIAGPNGMSDTDSPLTLLQYLALFYKYKRSFSGHLFVEARKAIERAVEAYPDCADMHACLSQIYSDGYRFGFETGESRAQMRHKALECARRAIYLAPEGSRGFHSLGLAYWLLQNVPASMKAMQTALALNPNAVDAMADLGLHWVLLGNRERGVALLEEALADDRTGFGTQRVGISLGHFMHGRFEDALVEAMSVDSHEATHALVAQAIAQIRLGRKSDAAETIKAIVRIAPLAKHETLFDLAAGNICRNLASSIGAALHDAGLPRTVGLVQ